MATAYRRAALSDVLVLAETVRLGFEGYRAWAPAGWDPPHPALDIARIRQDLARPDTWCVLAEDDGAVAGHASFTPARTRTGVSIPIEGLAHLWMLFVREPWWGTGLATELLEMAVAEARARAFTEMRLETPAGQARARAFYEREGWRVRGGPVYAPMLGLEIVEYRRRL